MVARLLKAAPSDPKLNMYAVQVYLAYGRSDLALEYYLENRKRFSGGAITVLRRLFTDALERGDEKAALLLMGEIVKYYGRKGHMPHETAVMMRTRASYLRFLVGRKRFEEAVRLADEYLARFAAAVEEEKNNPFWENKAYSDSLRKALRKYYYDVQFPSAAVNVLEMRGVALARLGKKDDLYAPILAQAEKIKTMRDDARYGVSACYSLYRAYTSLVNVALAAGDKEAAAGFKAEAAKHLADYRKRLEEYRKRMEENAKRAAEKKEQEKKKAE